ncbi:MAG: hypothetical protein EXS13_11250 [Planctomycetes bacterium]|nr:hypothetical protein [Planctomycetota bacterium]
MVSRGGSRRRRALVMVAAVVAASARSPLTAAQDDANGSTASSRDARWREFPVFVWFAGGPRQGPRSFATLKAAGLAGCNIEAGWEAADSVAARDAGLDFYVDHLAGKGDLWLRPAVFDRDRDAWKDDRLHFRPQRPTSLVDEATRARLLALVDAGLERHRGAAPLCWVLDDELSITRGVNPLDYCFAPETLRVFRKWLEARYGSIDAQNRACGTKWQRFDDVVPPTTGEARAAAEGVKLEDLQFAGWNDHREFMEVGLRELLVTLATPAAIADPGAPIGFTGGSFPSAFGGFDWGRLAPALTLHEPYETGAAPELVHSFKRAGAKVLSTLFVPDAPPVDWAPRELLARVARGDDGAVIWSSGPLLTDDGAALTAAGKKLSEWIGVARDLRRELVDAIDAPPRVFVLASQASARAGWMVDSWVDGKTFPNRLTSYEAKHSSTAAAREAWVECLRAWGIPWCFFDDRDGLPAAARQAPQHCAVVLPEAFALGDLVIEQLIAFVTAGGTLIADAHAALFDEALHGRDESALERLFGVRRAAGRMLEDLEASVAINDRSEGSLQGLAAEGDALAGIEGVTRNALGFERKVGRGRTLYLDCKMSGCVRGELRSELLQAAAVRLREWLASGAGGSSSGSSVADALVQLDVASIGRVALRSIVRSDGEWWVIAPTAALEVTRAVELKLARGCFGRVHGIGAAAAEAVAADRRTLRLRVAPNSALIVEYLPSK